MYDYFKPEPFDDFRLERQQKVVTHHIKQKTYMFEYNANEYRFIDRSYYMYYPGEFMIAKFKDYEVRLNPFYIIFGFFIKESDYKDRTFYFGKNWKEFKLVNFIKIQDYLYFPVCNNYPFDCSNATHDSVYIRTYDKNNNRINTNINLLFYGYNSIKEDYPSKLLQKEERLYFDSFQKICCYPTYNWIGEVLNFSYKIQGSYWTITNFGLTNLEYGSSLENIKPIKAKKQKFSKKFYIKCVDTICKNKINDEYYYLGHEINLLK